MFLGCSPCCKSCPIDADRLRLEFDGWADECTTDGWYAPTAWAPEGGINFPRRRLWSADNGGSITLFRDCTVDDPFDGVPTLAGVPLCKWSGWIHRRREGDYYTWTLDPAKGTLSFNGAVTFLPPGDSLSLECTVNNAAAGRLATQDAADVQPGMWVQRVPVDGQYLFAADTKVTSVDGNVITLSSPLLSPAAGAAAFLSPVTFLLPDEGAFGKLPFDDERPLLVASVAENVPLHWCDAVTVAISVGTGDYVPVTVAPTCPNIVRSGVDQVAASQGGYLYAKGHCSVHDEYAGEAVDPVWSDDPVPVTVDFSSSTTVHTQANPVSFTRSPFDAFVGLKLLNGTYELKPDVDVRDRHQYIGTRGGVTDLYVNGFGCSLTLAYGFGPGLYRFIDSGTGEEFFLPGTPPPYDNVGPLIRCSASLSISVWPELAKADRTRRYIGADKNGERTEPFMDQAVVPVCQGGGADQIAWHWSYRFSAYAEMPAEGLLPAQADGSSMTRRGSTDFVERTCAVTSFDDSVEFDWYRNASGGTGQVDKMTVSLSLSIG